jgi:hypothetical protein
MKCQKKEKAIKKQNFQHFSFRRLLILLSFTSVFGSVIAGVFQITFRAKIHANYVFLFFKNYF